MIGKDTPTNTTILPLISVQQGTSHIQDMVICGSSLYVIGTYSSTIQLSSFGTIDYNGGGAEVPFLLAVPAWTELGTSPQFFKALNNTSNAIHPSFIGCDLSSQQVFIVASAGVADTFFASFDVYDGSMIFSKLYRDVTVKSITEKSGQVLFMGIYNSYLWGLPAIGFNSTYVSSFSKVLFPAATS
jgi:hypothetical protein